jgi:hypothetical protein
LAIEHKDRVNQVVAAQVVLAHEVAAEGIAAQAARAAKRVGGWGVHRPIVANKPGHCQKPNSGFLRVHQGTPMSHFRNSLHGFIDSLRNLGVNSANLWVIFARANAKAAAPRFSSLSGCLSV